MFGTFYRCRISTINVHYRNMQNSGGRLYCDRMVVVSSNPGHGYVYSIQHYVIKFVSDLRQIAGFSRVLLSPPLIKLTAMI
jgi:hypothetical protein